MIAYFTASIVGKKDYLDNYLTIIRYLESKKIKVIANHIINSAVDKIRQIKRKERVKLHARLEKWIETCDFVVAEASFPSISVGYEISLALNLRKPVLILYGNGDPLALFAHHKEGSRLICEKYTLDSLCNTIDCFINYIKGSRDTRFTFFITPNIAAHLERIQKEERTPKSVYLRQLIERDMRKLT